MQKISVVISAYNEAHILSKCLDSVSWAAEIIVVDNESADATAKIAKQAGATLLTRPNNPMLNVNKNYGFTRASGDWILSLDADEQIPPELAREMQSTIEGSILDGYWMCRKNIIFGKWIEHGLWWPDKQLRLFRRGKGAFPCRHVHEYLAVDGPVGDLKNPFVHDNYQTVSQFIRKLDTVYTISEVETMRDSGYELSWTDAISFPVSDFVKIYFAQKGYKDGLHGLVLALLQAFYSFVVFAKLWEAGGFVQKDVTLISVLKHLQTTQRQIGYWAVTTRISQSKNFIYTLILRLYRKLAYAGKV